MINADQCPVERIGLLGLDAAADEPDHQQRHQSNGENRRRCHGVSLGEGEWFEHPPSLLLQGEDPGKGDGNHQQGDKNKLNLLEWRLGYRIAATDNIYTAFGAGFDIKNRKPDFRLLSSVSFILPKERQKIRKIYEE